MARMPKSATIRKNANVKRLAKQSSVAPAEPINDGGGKFADSGGNGYDYAYLYPGLQKVVQAAGRVIRSTDDSGVVYLLDDRFGQRAVQALLPGWWQVDTVKV
mgnify:CR=1 FL=1